MSKSGEMRQFMMIIYCIGQKDLKTSHISEHKRKLLNKQKGKCTLCSSNFQYGDVMEVDHIIPLKAGGKRSTSNIQLVHRHCHHSKTRNE